MSRGCDKNLKIKLTINNFDKIQNNYCKSKEKLVPTNTLTFPLTLVSLKNLSDT